MQPTLETILARLEEAGHPITRRQLSDDFGLDHAESDRLIKPLLQELIRQGKVVRNRRAAYGLARNMDLIKGRISAHADGFGFVIPDEDGDDLFLAPRQMRQVFHGDRVLAAVSGVDRRGRKEGQIVEVIERAHQQIVGRFVAEGGVAQVVPDDPKLTHDVLIPDASKSDAKPGRIVVARVTSPPAMSRGPVGEIIAVLGHADEPGMATQIAIFNHQLPAEFPAAVEQQAEDCGAEIDPAIAARRTDLRDMPLITIDGADARDFDDAVHAEADGEGFRLIVAIADVGEYVEPGTPLDDEAQSRGTSTYFPDRVVPMLPEALSNGLCSLNPEVDRLVLACEMQVAADGKVTGSRFFEAVMRSAARMTYDQVRNMIERGDEQLNERYGHVRANLDCLFEVYRLLARRRAKRGAIDFDSSEVVFVFDAEGRVEQLQRRTRHDAHRLIEECMIAANVEAARTAEKNGLPTLFRVHDVPPPDKLAELEAFLSAHGIGVNWKDEPEPADLTRIQKKARETPLAPLVDAVLLRSLALAVYQPENNGHFGLALDAYAHFTSPIRRYPDLLLHRALKHHLRKKPKGEYPYSAKRMTEFGRECSWLERRAEDASREVDERLKCQYMQRHIGDELEGVITGVTGFGVFVEIIEMGVSGLVHVTSLPNDYYHFDPVGRVLTGERRGLRYRLADPVRVEVMSVSVDERKIDFRIAGEREDDTPEKRAGGRGKKSGKSRRGGRGKS
ncbi:MAG: ribonuclease R, partial [Wenzhouxiangellaceae bacterium]|nr:ribonuclease R [Wenzhouxiangellaceae bacterium]